MKIRYALEVIYASTLSLSGVCAIELDVDSPDSIKNAAKALSTNLRKYYTGDRLGDVPGNLPDPYYWWECGAMFNAFIDYWYYTGDDQYNAITEQALQHQIGDYNAFMPPNQTRTLGNDDQAFWGMAAMSAAENKLPDAKDGPSWLSLAQATWEWEQSIGLISSDFHFFDGTGDSENCTSIKKIQWTYNAGVHISGAAAMWNVVRIRQASLTKRRTFADMNQTQNQLWKDRVQGILDGLDVFFKDGVMTEVACENNGMCNVDQRSFKAYLARWLGYTAIVAPWTREQIDPLLKASAKAAAAQCNAGADQVSCGLRWTKNGINDGSFGVGEQMAALEIVQALLYPTVDGPATAERGGISQSNPNAGIEAPNDDGSTHFDSISTRDRVGASVLTVLVVGGSLVGVWWMVS
ncbi:unnamed protein product [Alternaria alternata]